MTTFVFHPTHGGPHPVVLYLMDAPSIRPALHGHGVPPRHRPGYYVLLPFLFYRGSEFKEFGDEDADMHQRFELMGTVTPTNIVPDAEALLAFAADDPAAADGPVGAVGLLHERRARRSRSRGPCRTASRPSPRSTGPGWCATPTTRRTAASTECGPRCTWPGAPTTPPRRPSSERSWSRPCRTPDVTYTLDWHDDAVHGFAPPGPRHHRAASELHWERVHSLLRRRAWAETGVSCSGRGCWTRPGGPGRP